MERIIVQATAEESISSIFLLAAKGSNDEMLPLHLPFTIRAFMVKPI
jgi:hypothetical protein